MCRPPGHHAGRDFYGGYCYLNNAAAAAQIATNAGARVAVLDVDFHHGNGTQDIFYDRNDVAFTSIHADPRDTYPYFAGYANETGGGAGEGFTLNLPVPRTCDVDTYREALISSLAFIQKFSPDVLTVSLGTDISGTDPIGKMDIPITAFRSIGRMIGGCHVPTVVVQEGGYDVMTIGKCVNGFLEGLVEELC
jgi:acetoin utilization deacetylase AcuC-like enzyme